MIDLNIAKGTIDWRIKCCKQSLLPKESKNKIFLSFDQKVYKLFGAVTK